MEKQIFTFWEPENTLFPYLNLCMQTWKKFYPEYSIHKISYNNVFEYIDKQTYDFETLKQFSLPIQADAIRVALLHKHGGVWMDCDTIISNSNLFESFDTNSECNMFGNANQKVLHIGLIAAKPESTLLTYWLENIQQRLVDEEQKKQADWSYLGNGIINTYWNSITNKTILNCIDKISQQIIIEENFMQDKRYKLPAIDNYRYFWFENNFINYINQKRTNGICLHNSWTPDTIKQMSEADFLRTDCTLSSLIKQALEIEDNAKSIYYSYMSKRFIDLDNIDKSNVSTLKIDELEYSMYLPDRNDIEQSLILDYKKPKEYEVIIDMRACVTAPKESYLIDIGHNCGNHAAYFAALGLTVHAFDPNRHLNKVLEKTIDLNKFSNIALYNLGLSDKEFETSFQKITPQHSGSMSLETEKQTLCDVHVITLDSLHFEFPKNKTIVKIDVEGMELNVLKGMSATIERISPIAFFIEIHNLSQLKTIYNFLAPYGYIMDNMMVSHTCKFIKEDSKNLQAFISEQRYLTKEIFNLLCETRRKDLVALKHSAFWNSLLLNPNFVLPPEISCSENTDNSYLQFYINNIDRRVHYEIMKVQGKIFCCLHCEDATLSTKYKNLFIDIANTNNTTCSAGNKLQINIKTTPRQCIDDMRKLISSSLENIITHSKTL